MSIQEHTTPEKLERYAFLWSLARMVIAAVSLFFGAMPIAYTLGIGMGLLPLFWIVSGAASLYLLYLWYQSGRTVFGSNDPKNLALFLIMVITGINLGITGLGGNNIGMGIFWGMSIASLIFKATAIVYLGVAYMLWRGWRANGEHLFGGQLAKTSAQPPAESTS